MKNTQPDDTKVNVESEADVKTFSSPFLLDHVSLVFTIIFLGSLIAFLIFRSNTTSERNTYYPCNQSYQRYSLHFDMTIESFTELHKYVNVWVAGQRNISGVEESKPVNFSVDTSGMRNKVTIGFYRTPTKQSEFHFPSGAIQSDKLFMTKILLNSSYDSVKVHFMYNSDFNGFAGIHVYWTFNTAPKQTYIVFLQVLLPATTLYLTIHFIFHFTSMTEQFTQLNIIILGGISVLASLPYNFLFGTNPLTKYPIFFFTAVMVSYFRYVVTSQIQLEAEGTQSPDWKFNIPIIIFFVVYAFIELGVTFSDGANAATLETAVTALNYGYIIISILFTAYAFLKSELGFSRRLILMVVLQALSFLLVLRDQDYESILSAYNSPIQRTLTFGAAHVFMVSYLLILLQICSDVGYSEISAHNNDQASLLKDKVGVDLNIEQEFSEEEDTSTSS